VILKDWNDTYIGLVAKMIPIGVVTKGEQKNI